MIKEIEDFDGLEALRLEGNTVGVEAARVIAKALEKKSELKVRCPRAGRPRLVGDKPLLKEPQNFLGPCLVGSHHDQLLSLWLPQSTQWWPGPLSLGGVSIRVLQ